MPDLPSKIAFVDIETTGASLRHDRVLEIGVLRVEDGVITQTFKTVINPQHYVPEQIFSLTGIDRGEIDGAPTFYDIHDQLLAILDDCVFVAHNVRFDYSFLKQEFARLDHDWAPKHFCTVKLSRSLYPGQRRHNLDAVMERLGIECANRHRAFDDAAVLWEFYQKVQQLFDSETIIKAVNLALRRPTVPLKLSLKELEVLPETPGVYIFYGEKGAPLYIGKSVNLRRRVLSHFSSDHLSSTEMKITQQIESIETIQTCGELGALIKESQLIKQMQPLYNRKLRKSRKMLVLKEVTTKDGYKSVRLEVLYGIQIDDVDQILGSFKSKKQAQGFLLELAREHGLCEKLLGIDNSSTACFGYRLGRCKGACASKEPVGIYNLKFINAFTKYKLVSWPFDGAIEIEEKDIDSKKSEKFVIDRWCFMGSVSADEEQTGEISKEYEFDLDLYKILRSHIKNGVKPKQVKRFQSVETESSREQYFGEI
jgi:DNA polymerase III subunit epsilon